jgi:hypothetical protein
VTTQPELPEAYRRKPPPDHVLPCGCVVGNAWVNSEPVFWIRPCRTGCPNLAEALRQSRERAMPVEFRSSL